jgi:tetratricopeptide (TPR) repeat protein
MQSATVSLPVRKKPKDAPASLPKVVIGSPSSSSPSAASPSSSSPSAASPSSSSPSAASPLPGPSSPKVELGARVKRSSSDAPPPKRMRPLKDTLAEGPDAKRLEEAAKSARASAERRARSTETRGEQSAPPPSPSEPAAPSEPAPSEPAPSEPPSESPATEDEPPVSEPPVTQAAGTPQGVTSPDDTGEISVDEEVELPDDLTFEEDISVEEEISIDEEISFDDDVDDAPEHEVSTKTSIPPPVPKARKRAADMTVEDHLEAGDLARSLGHLDESVAHYKKGLAKLGTEVTPERAAIYMRLGHVMRAKGNLRVAVSNFDKALGITPNDRDALAALIELNAEQGNWRGVNNAEQKFLAGADDGPDKLAMLLASGDRWLTRAEDKRRAKERYAQARDEFPDDVEPLRRLVRIYDAEGAHDYALEARRTIAEMASDPRERAQVYFELGELCLDELGKEAEAYAAFEQALDADPTMLNVLEVLATALADHQEWGELERIYHKMVEKFSSRASDEATQTVLAELHHRRALLYRDHLEDPEHALESIDHEIALRPGQLSTRIMAAELAAEIGDGPRALDHLRAAASLEPTRAETYRQLFALGQRFDAPEIAFQAASVLHVLDLAGDRERIVYQEHRTDVPPHARPLPPEAWALLREERDTSVEEVMRAVAPAVLRTRVKQLSADGKLPELPEEFRQDPATSTVSAVRSLNWAARYLGVACPDIYVDPKTDATFQAPFAHAQSTVVGKGAHAQSTVVGKGALSGRTLCELAFLAGRHLGYRLPEHELVAHLNTVDELTLCFLAALKLVLGKAPVSGAVAEAVDTFGKLLSSQQTPEERESLIAAVDRFSEAGGRVSLNEWIRAVELCCHRAGLIMCGDLRVAVALLEEEGDSPYLTVKQRVDDLCAFAVSKAYARLRLELGSSLEEEDAPLSAVQ